MTNLYLLQKGDLKESDFTNDNSNNKQGIGIRLSSDNGNLLQQRKNGLYYGVEAPPDLARLYVDAVNGVDQHPEDVAGAGTRAKPLKTFTYANRIALEGTRRTIYLMADQDHIVDSARASDIKAGFLTVEPYGPVFDEYKLVNESVIGAIRAMRADNKLPRLVLTGFGTYKWYGNNVTDVAQLTSIYNRADSAFIGVHIILDNEGSFEPTAPERTTLHAYYAARILNEESLTLSSCRVTSKGTTVTSPQYVSGIVSVYTKETGIISRFNKNFIGLVASSTRKPADTTIISLIYESDNMFTSFPAWGRAYYGSISLQLSGLTDNHDITNYVFRKTFDDLPNGGKVLINPTTDVPSNQWY